MPHRKSTAFPRERLAIMVLYSGITRIMRETVRDETLISAWVGVHIGDLDGKPMSATKLGQYIGMPRNTVLRKLETLEKQGLIVCTRGLYYLDPQRAAAPPVDIVQRYAAVMARAIAALGYIPVISGAKYPKRTVPTL